MTALMVLFLVVMSVALLAVTKTVSDREQAIAERALAIDSCLDELETAARDFSGVTVDRVGHTINFGERAYFDYNSATLSPEKRKVLRQFVPRVLNVANMQCGKDWLRRIVVEGFTDRTGSYLYNLDLSLRRSQSVICALVDLSDGLPLAQREQIRELFLVGGYAFNLGKATPEESRRIELRLEFFGLDEVRPTAPDITQGDFGRCQVR
jgi:flagellar motor protein MotB